MIGTVRSEVSQTGDKPFINAWLSLRQPLIANQTLRIPCSLADLNELSWFCVLGPLLPYKPDWMAIGLVMLGH